ncbi:uncharacterized protein LOC121593281 [Anopheles merus]|uniref:uncharacterized protein LOC121593281 n=1 Tax=Anopheles merus TaxID=30066 RepID=UPI001BE407FA|nr:uncharacterized protein LOC121593281 [Anopheles merus]
MDQTQLLPAIASEVATLMMLLIEEEEEENQQEIERRCWMTDLFLERESVWSRLFRAIDREGPNGQLNSFLRVNKEEFYYLLSRIGPRMTRDVISSREDTYRLMLQNGSRSQKSLKKNGIFPT